MIITSPRVMAARRFLLLPPFLSPLRSFPFLRSLPFSLPPPPITSPLTALALVPSFPSSRHLLCQFLHSQGVFLILRSFNLAYIFSLFSFLFFLKLQSFPVLSFSPSQLISIVLSQESRPFLPSLFLLLRLPSPNRPGIT